jgi:hypothetical protein
LYRYIEATMRAGMTPICAPMMSRKLDAVVALLGADADADVPLDVGVPMTPRALCALWNDVGAPAHVDSP